ncbi:MAG: Nif11-like leader peptide family RiPP precursor [Terrimicrobiaceae bacterium]|nr:Nif11-like leader peptide family RiPP precursor [Terrimicrobiaceae bacterium]
MPINPHLQAFRAAVTADPDLTEKVRAIFQEHPADAATHLAALAASRGWPISVSDLQTMPGDGSLSDADLDSVAGGAWRASEDNILVSILGFGLVCAGFAAASKIRGGEDKCQPDQY